MKTEQLDHLVLTVRDIDKTCNFYRLVLGMDVQNFGNDRKALGFGSQKINLDEYGRELSPAAASPLPGSADLCFITAVPLREVIAHLESCRVENLAGPVDRNGATGPLSSVYCRDPDGNLLEIAVRR